MSSRGSVRSLFPATCPAALSCQMAASGFTPSCSCDALCFAAALVLDQRLLGSRSQSGEVQTRDLLERARCLAVCGPHRSVLCSWELDSIG